MSVTTWNQITLKVLLPSVFDMEELLSALATKLQSKRCAGCPICRLQKSSMEVWIITPNGIGNFLNLFFRVSFFARKAGNAKKNCLHNLHQRLQKVHLPYISTHCIEFFIFYYFFWGGQPVARHVMREKGVTI